MFNFFKTLYGCVCWDVAVLTGWERFRFTPHTNRESVDMLIFTCNHKVDRGGRGNREKGYKDTEGGVIRENEPWERLCLLTMFVWQRQHTAIVQMWVMTNISKYNLFKLHSPHQLQPLLTQHLFARQLPSNLLKHLSNYLTTTHLPCNHSKHLSNKSLSDNLVSIPN